MNMSPTSRTSDSDNPEGYLLKIGAGNEQGVPGVPLLPPYYAYLLKISQSVGLVDIYPFLAELMFHARAVPSGPSLTAPEAAVNIVSIFIDDQRDNIANSMLPEGSVNEDDAFLARCLHDESDPKIRPRNFIIDTFGEFGAGDLNERLETSIGEAGNQSPVYLRTSLVGAGNPMRMMQRFTAINNLKEMPKTPKGDHPLNLGQINCLLLSSISYLYRTMGFRDAMLLVRQMLERGVWKPGMTRKNDGRMLEQDGLLFAILHEGVFRDDEIRYAETFFDAVIRFDSLYCSRWRFVTYGFEMFPLVGGHGYRKPDEYLPRFDQKYAYLPTAGQRLKAVAISREYDKVYFEQDMNSPLRKLINGVQCSASAGEAV